MFSFLNSNCFYIVHVSETITAAKFIQDHETWKVEGSEKSDLLPYHVCDGQFAEYGRS